MAHHLKRFVVVACLACGLVAVATGPLRLRLFDGQSVSATYIPQPYRSIQPISVTHAGAATSNTYTTSPTIIATNSILIFQGTTADDAGAAGFTSDFLVGTITNGTTVTVSRVGSGTVGSLTYNAILVEFIGQFVKSQGCGSTAAIPDDGVSTTATATISSVNTAKTLVAFTGFTSTNGASWTSGTGPGFWSPRITLLNATTIQASRGSATVTGYGITPGYCYVEFR